LSLDRFWGEFRMPSGRKKEVVDERAEKVFSGIQATGGWGVAGWRLYFSAAQSSVTLRRFENSRNRFLPLCLVDGLNVISKAASER